MPKFEVKGKIVEACSKTQALARYNATASAVGIKNTASFPLFFRLMKEDSDYAKSGFNEKYARILFDYYMDAYGEEGIGDLEEFVGDLFKSWTLYPSVEDAMKDFGYTDQFAFQNDAKVLFASDSAGMKNDKSVIVNMD